MRMPPMAPRVAMRTDKNARVVREVGHADAVAEDRTARIGARGIDRDDGDPLSLALILSANVPTSVDLPVPGTPVNPTM